MSFFYLPPPTCQVPNMGGKWEALFGRRTTGYFVEVGAYDGESFSNTSCLADVGWSGLYVEPIAEFAEKCRLRHAENAGVSVVVAAAAEAAGETEIFVGDTLTTIVGEQVEDYEKIDWAKGLHQGQKRKIATETLDTLLGRVGAPTGFDVLVVDVEGAEDRVLAGFDLEMWKPKALLIELEDEHPDFRDNDRVVRQATAVRRRLESAGYRIYFRDHINSLYVRADVLDQAQPEIDDASLAAPLVSIGLPTYNRPRFLDEAIQSLLGQTFSDFELIISDNHSPDVRVREICLRSAAKDARVRYIRQPENLGALQNYRFVLASARGSYFMWAPDDDLWSPSFVERGVECLRGCPSISAWFSNLEVINRSGNVMRQIPNLKRFTSRYKPFDLYRYLFEPEVQGKANIIYSLFRKADLESNMHLFNENERVWGGDMVFMYGFLCRFNIEVESDKLFTKRADTDDAQFNIDDPRRYICPAKESKTYYKAFASAAKNTRYFLFTRMVARWRYSYDRLYTRFFLSPAAH